MKAIKILTLVTIILVTIMLLTAPGVQSLASYQSQPSPYFAGKSSDQYIPCYRIGTTSWFTCGFRITCPLSGFRATYMHIIDYYICYTPWGAFYTHVQRVKFVGCGCFGEPKPPIPRPGF